MIDPRRSAHLQGRMFRFWANASKPKPTEVDPAVRLLGASARLQAMFDAHHAMVWRILRRYGLDADAAADIGQQAYLVALERIADIRPGSERAFLVGTALRLARSSGRKTARLQLETSLDQQLPAVGQPESQAIVLELLDRVLSQLDPTLVEVFMLFDVEGFSAPEIARALGIPAGTVASRVRRAREEFRLVVSRLGRVFEREARIR